MPSEAERCRAELSFLGVVVYIASYVAGVVTLCLLWLTTECNHMEPAAEVVAVRDLHLADTDASCVYDVTWVPKYTPFWSLTPRSSGKAAYDRLRLPCPSEEQQKGSRLFIDGCYLESVRSPHLVHRNSFEEYFVVDVAWFRFLGTYLVFGPMLLLVLRCGVLSSLADIGRCIHSACFSPSAVHELNEIRGYTPVNSSNTEDVYTCENENGTPPPPRPFFPMSL